MYSQGGMDVTYLGSQGRIRDPGNSEGDKGWCYLDEVGCDEMVVL